MYQNVLAASAAEHRRELREVARRDRLATLVRGFARDRRTNR